MKLYVLISRKDSKKPAIVEVQKTSLGTAGAVAEMINELWGIEIGQPAVFTEVIERVLDGHKEEHTQLIYELAESFK